MKRIFCFLFVFSCISTHIVSAQVCGTCAIDYGFVVPGVYPDTLPPATAGEYYETDITFVFPTDTTVDVVGTLAFLNFHIMEPVGVPYGMQVSTNLGDFPVDYDPGVSVYGCARVCGTPLVAGWYEVTVPLVATLEYPGGDQATEYSLFIEVLPPVPAAGGIIPTVSFGCEPLTVDFETSIHSAGAAGFTYTWDFGNGNTSTAEFPPTQTYTAIGGLPTDYIITHTVSIDTIGYSLDYVTVVSSGCDDCTIFGCTGLIENEKPDFYLIIDALGINTEPGVSNTSPPVTFPLGNELDPFASYTLQVKDDDGGLAGSDDNCGSFDFNGDDVGIFSITAGSHEVEVGISHPVIAYTFYDTITVYPAVEIPAINIVGETIFCTGDSTIFNTSYNPELTYQWYKDGDEIPGADSSEIIVLETGVYKLIVTGVGGCNATSSETSIEVFEQPAVPSIIAIANVLSTTSTWDVQWYYDGDPIPGATETSYTPAIEGIYQVAAINGPCIAFSNELNFTFQDVIESESANGIKIYPNPNNGIFTCEFNLMKAENVELRLVNLLGEEIISAHLESASGSMIQTFNIQNQNPGIYFLIMKGESVNYVIKVSMSGD